MLPLELFIGAVFRAKIVIISVHIILFIIKKAPKCLFRLFGYKVVNPEDHAARAKTSSLAAFAVIVLLD